MQLRSRSARRAAFVAGLVVAVFVVTGAEARAQSQEQDAESATPTPPPSEPIDTSKHGTVEAEIPARAESTTGVPDRATLKDRLMEPRWDRGGFFIGLGGHYAVELSEQIGGTDGLASGGGLSMRVGLKHDRFWQTEFSGMYTSKFKADGDEFFAWGIHLGERFYLTKTRLQPYVGAHVGFLALYGSNYVGSTYGFVPKFNAGLNFYQHQTLNWELDLSYYLGEIGAAQDSSFATATLGFTWF